MSMGMHVEAFRPPDDKWRAMRAVWDACAAAGVAPPDEVSKFFDWKEPDDRGVVVALEWLPKDDPQAHGDRRLHPAVSEDGREWGYTIEIAKLPEHVTHIRVWAS